MRALLAAFLAALALPLGAQQVDLARQVKGVLPQANGGTGSTSAAITIGSTSVSPGGTAAIVAGLELTRPSLTVQALTDAASIAWNMASGNVATVTVSTAGRALANPTNLPTGSAALLITYSGTGTITSFGSAFKWPGGTGPTMTNSNGKLDMLTCNTFGSSNLYCSVALDVR